MALEPQQFEDCLDHLRGQPEDFVRLADAALVVEQRRLPVHAAVLSQHSAWFRCLFASIKDGLASSPDGLSLREPLEGVELAPFCSFLRCVYSPTPATVRQEMVCVRQEGGDVLFDYSVEALLALALQFDVPALIELVEEVATEEPTCRLALLMDPLRWLLVCDEYQHLGHLQKLRSTAISFLTAKFSALQSDTRLDKLSAPTLAEVVRMAGYRLSSLASSCGHVQAVQDRAAQRFTATAQQVASGYCPDASQASSYVTHWWLNPTTNCIKLSWSLASDVQQQHGAAAVAPLQDPQPMQAAAAAAPAAPHHHPAAAQQQLAEEQQQQQQQQLADAAGQLLPGAAVGLAQQAAALQQALGQVALLQQHPHHHHHHQPLQLHLPQQLMLGPVWDLVGNLSDDEEEDEMDMLPPVNLAPLLQAAAMQAAGGDPAAAAAAAAGGLAEAELLGLLPPLVAPGAPLALGHPLISQQQQGGFGGNGGARRRHHHHGQQQHQQQQQAQLGRGGRKARFHPY